jgi:hypothetical protein
VPGGSRQARLRYAACPHCLEQQRIERGFSWLRRAWVLAPRTVCSIHLVALVEGQIGRILHPVWSQFLRQNQRSDRAICVLAQSSSALESPPPVSMEHGVMSVSHHEMDSIQDTLIGNASRRLHWGKRRSPVEGRAAVIADIIARLRGEWEADYARWQRRDLSARRYVYIWADGAYLQARMEPQAECMPVLIGATPDGKKELLGFQVGVRESGQSWRELLLDLKARGLSIAPEVATGDGALGFWKALDEVSPTTRHQGCTVHKTANVLDTLPKSVQPAAKSDLREIWKAPGRATAEAAITTFADKYGARYNKVVACLVKNRDALLTFYDFPAKRWDHLRTSNPIESVFATVRRRTVRTKGALSQDTARLMVFKLVTASAKNWRRLKGENQLPKVVQGVRFANGVEVTHTPAQNAA